MVLDVFQCFQGLRELLRAHGAHDPVSSPFKRNALLHLRAERHERAPHGPLAHTEPVENEEIGRAAAGDGGQQFLLARAGRAVVEPLNDLVAGVFLFKAPKRRLQAAVAPDDPDEYLLILPGGVTQTGESR